MGTFLRGGARIAWALASNFFEAHVGRRRGRALRSCEASRGSSHGYLTRVGSGFRFRSWRLASSAPHFASETLESSRHAIRPPTSVLPPSPDKKIPHAVCWLVRTGIEEEKR